MVYSKERLQRALDVFRASEPYRNRQKLAGSNLEKFLESRSKQYETRSGNTSLALRTTITGTWNDKDESGDYNPRKKKTVAKAQKFALGGSKRKRCDGSACPGNRAAKKPKALYTTGRQKGLSLEVTFKFKSDAAKAKVAELFFTATLGLEINEEAHLLGKSEEDDMDGSSSLFARHRNPPFPHSQPTSSLCRKLIAKSLEDNHKEYYAEPMQRALDSPPTHDSLPSATKSNPIIIDDSDDCTTNFDDLDDIERRQAALTTSIETNWAHPIEYRCSPEACSFCLDFRYALFGCGVVNIQVIKIKPGVYEEIGGGHRERGIGPTKICLNCSLERLAIAKCPEHEILCIEGYLEEQFDYQSFLSRTAASPRAEHLTCSVCIKPACYACATRQKEDVCGLPATGEDDDGCGLLLCRDCAGVVASCGLDMEQLERNSGSSKRLRADRSFLLPGSDLWQAWRN
jgi:hypothetical protein